MGRKFSHDKQYLKISYRHEPLRLLYQSLENVFILFTSMSERTEEFFMFTSAKRHGISKTRNWFLRKLCEHMCLLCSYQKHNVHQAVNTLLSRLLCISFIQICIRFQLLMSLPLISFSSSGSSSWVGGGGQETWNQCGRLFITYFYRGAWPFRPPPSDPLLFCTTETACKIILTCVIWTCCSFLWF